MRSLSRFLIGFLLLLTGYSSMGQGCTSNPTVANAGNDSTICSSNNVVYLAGSVRRATGGQWSGGTGVFSPNNTTLNATYVPSQAEINAGQVKLVLLTTGSVCTPKRDTLKITIIKAPSPQISGPNTLCEYSSGNSYSVTPSAGSSYEWHVVGGAIQSGQNSASIQVNWGAEGPGYIYMLQTTSQGCQGVGSINPISRFDFNNNDLLQATIGPNAVSKDADVFSDGMGVRITSNCGGTKGLDLSIPGAAFDRGKMCMTFSWQRDESEARFFTRGFTEFYINGGILLIKLRVDSAGQSRDIGPINTGYTVPFDDVFRFFTFCYDSASGISRVLVNDSIVWNYKYAPNVSLHWTSAGNAVLGGLMDGNCSGKSLLDWSNVSIPISIVPRPSSAVSGNNSVCLNSTETYQCTDVPYTSYSWNVSGGSILGGQGTRLVQVRWNATGIRTVSVLLTDTVNTCDSLYTYAVTVNAIPAPVITGNDSLCSNSYSVYRNLKLANHAYSWQTSSGTITGTSTADTVLIQWGAAGYHWVYVRMTNTGTGCYAGDTLRVRVKAPPSPSFFAPTSVCQGEITQHIASPSSSGYRITWTVSPAGGIISGQGSDTCVLQWNVTGNRALLLLMEDLPFGCATEVTRNVFVRPRPIGGDIWHY